jgi:TPR repeat protein
MRDELQLQIVPGGSDSLLSLTTTRSGLITRGRADAAILIAHNGDEFEASLGVVLCDVDDIDARDVYCGKALLDEVSVSPENKAPALEFFRRAADQGNATAMFNIGAMYTHGREVEQDYIKAAEWYLKAVHHGHLLTYFNVGVMYQNGLGFEQNYAVAARFYRAAAEGTPGDPPLFDPKVICRLDNTSASDLAEASEWFGRTQRGVPAAQFNLGGLYEAGAGVSRDYLSAYVWMKLAADRVGEAGRYAVGRDRVLGKMSDTEVAQAERLAKALGKLAEKRNQKIDDVMTALKRSLEARRSARR